MSCKKDETITVYTLWVSSIVLKLSLGNQGNFWKKIIAEQPFCRNHVTPSQTEYDLSALVVLKIIIHDIYIQMVPYERKTPFHINIYTKATLDAENSI